MLEEDEPDEADVPDELVGCPLDAVDAPELVALPRLLDATVVEELPAGVPLEDAVPDQLVEPLRLPEHAVVASMASASTAGACELGCDIRRFLEWVISASAVNGRGW